MRKRNRFWMMRTKKAGCIITTIPRSFLNKVFWKRRSVVGARTSENPGEFSTVVTGPRSRADFSQFPTVLVIDTRVGYA
jgi:hypothetical protein